MDVWTGQAPGLGQVFAMRFGVGRMLLTTHPERRDRYRSLNRCGWKGGYKGQNRMGTGLEVRTSFPKLGGFKRGRRKGGVGTLIGWRLLH